MNIPLGYTTLLNNSVIKDHYVKFITNEPSFIYSTVTLGRSCVKIFPERLISILSGQFDYRYWDGINHHCLALMLQPLKIRKQSRIISFELAPQ